MCYGMFLCLMHWKNDEIGLVWLFYGVSAFVGYSILDLVIYIKNIYKKVTFLKEPELICLHTVKWLQVLLFVVCSQLNGFKYCYLILIVLVNISHLFTHS